jgi:predicted metalloprotease with PDZ domain
MEIAMKTIPTLGRSRGLRDPLRPALWLARFALAVLVAATAAGSAAAQNEGPPPPPRPPDTAVDPAVPSPPSEPAPPNRGWLGVQVQPLDEGLREAFDFRQPGVLVGFVAAGSPAERAGFQRGDIIVSIDGKKVESPSDLTGRIREHDPGETVEIGRVRDKREQRVKVQLEATPARVPGARRARHDYLRSAHLGARVEQLNPDLASYFAAEADQGALVVAVPADSPADKAGLKAGDIIVGMSGNPIRTPGDLYAWMDERKPGDVAHVEILRRGKRQTLDVTLGESPLTDRVRRAVRLAPRDMDPMMEGLKRRFDAERESLKERVDRLEKALKDLEGRVSGPGSETK